MIILELVIWMVLIACTVLMIDILQDKILDHIEKNKMDKRLKGLKQLEDRKPFINT